MKNPNRPYYNDDEFCKILGSYNIKRELRDDGAWSRRFRDRLESLAWIYSNAKEEEATIPSIIKREIESLRRSSSSLLSRLTKANEDIYIAEEIKRAAIELASIYGLPDFELESTTYYGLNGAPTTTTLSWPVTTASQIESPVMTANTGSFFPKPRIAGSPLCDAVVLQSR